MEYLILLILSALGFLAYEVGIRIIDMNTFWIKRIGNLKYLVYLFVFGGAICVVSAGFVEAFIPSGSLQYSISVLLGMGLPSTIRVFSEVVVKIFYKKVESTISSKGDKSEKTAMNEEIVSNKGYQYKDTGYLIAEIFGFHDKL